MYNPITSEELYPLKTNHTIQTRPKPYPIESKTQIQLNERPRSNPIQNTDPIERKTKVQLKEKSKSTYPTEN